MKHLLLLCLVVTACGGKGAGSSTPAPNSSRVQVNADRSRATPLTSGEHADTAKLARTLGCEVKLTDDEHIETLACVFESATYKITFEKSGDQAGQTIWCETAEENIGKCESMTFDKLLDPKPAATSDAAPGV